MKFTIKKEEILKGLQRIQGVVDKKNTMPILANMLLTAEKGGLEIVATDLEIGLRGKYNAEVATPGAVAVSAKKMYEIARELPEEDVQVQVDENNWVKMVSGHSQFKLVGLPKGEYPTLPEVVEEGMIAVEGDVLRDMIRKTLYASSTDETRFNFTGVLLEMAEVKKNAGGGPNAASTTHIASRATTEMETGSAAGSRGTARVRAPGASTRSGRARRSRDP